MSNGVKSSCYLYCCVLQEQAPLFCLLLPGTHLIHPALLLTAKSLVWDASTVKLSLQNWEKFFDILPLESGVQEQIFKQMLCSCKVTKFWQVNYKILSCILAIPKTVAAVQKEENIQWCAWCGDQAMFEHILLTCKEIALLHKWVCSGKAFEGVRLVKLVWIFGSSCPSINPIIWLTNFTIYKYYLLACAGQKVLLLDQIQNEFV